MPRKDGTGPNGTLKNCKPTGIWRGKRGQRNGRKPR